MQLFPEKLTFCICAKYKPCISRLEGSTTGIVTRFYHAVESFRGRSVNQNMPPGKAATIIESPNRIEIAKIASLLPAILPKSMTIAPSRTPQPAIEIGIKLTNMIAGTRQVYWAKVNLAPRLTPKI